MLAFLLYLFICSYQLHGCCWMYCWKELFKLTRLILPIIAQIMLLSGIQLSHITGSSLDTAINSLGPEGHCTSRFKRSMCISCQPHVDVHKWEGRVRLMWTHVYRGMEVKILIFCGRHKWMAPYLTFYVHACMWPCRRLASTHFLWRPATSSD